MKENISKYLTKKENNQKKNYKNKLMGFLNKILICVILGISLLIIMKKNDDFKNFMDKKVFKDNLSFAYINDLYNKYFGSVLPSYKTEEVAPVFKEKLEYKTYNKFHDGYKLEVSNSYLTPVIESGIIVYIGEMDLYGNVLIVEGIDGVDIWYGNISNINGKLYDYVNSGDFIGETKDNYLYLVFQKNGEYLDFETYIKD